MSTYVCHFDASVQNNDAACAFVINCNGLLVYQGAVVIRKTKADLAEAKALLLLLKHIEKIVNSDDIVKICGDAKGVIDSVNGDATGRYNEVSIIIKKLRERQKVSLLFVPRGLNKAADKLARSAISSRASRLIELTDIIVAEGHVLPGEKKMERIESYFRSTGMLPTNIRVSERNRLICGYGEYVTLVNAGVKSWMVSA